MPSGTARTPLPEADYHRHAQAALAHIEAMLDQWLQDDIIDVDGNRTGGLLELTLPDRSKVVINLQPPLQELWLATKAGGHHYYWEQGVWRDTRDGSELFAALSQHLSAQAGQALSIQPPPI